MDLFLVLFLSQHDLRVIVVCSFAIFQVFYSTDGRHYQAVPTSYTDGTPVTFTGNTDSSTPVTHMFNLITARWIR